MYFVYILQCSDGTYYTGITNDINRRLEEHQSGLNSQSYTAKRLPVSLVFKAEYSDPTTAIAFEKKIKKWSVAKKKALIEGKFESLPELAKKKNWGK